MNKKNNNSIQKIGFFEGATIGLCFCMDHSLDSQSQSGLMLEVMEYADRSGFSFAWGIDEYFHNSTGIKLNSAVFHSAVSVRTSKINLRGECLFSPKRDVIRTAEDWSIIDNLSNGRIGVVVPRNIDDVGMGDRFVEYVSELRDLWKGSTVKRVNGVGDEVHLRIFPVPIQEQLPIWVSIDADNELEFRKAGELGLNLLMYYEEESQETWLNNIKHYRKALSSSKYAMGNGKVTVIVDVEVGCNKQLDDKKPVRRTDTMNNTNGTQEFIGSRCPEISEEKFLAFYNNIKKNDLCVDEIAFKVDLKKGEKATFKYLERLEGYLGM